MSCRTLTAFMVRQTLLTSVAHPARTTETLPGTDAETSLSVTVAGTHSLGDREGGEEREGREGEGERGREREREREGRGEIEVNNQIQRKLQLSRVRQLLFGSDQPGRHILAPEETWHQ